jgi:lysophospholipase L1-like esterase
MLGIAVVMLIGAEAVYRAQAAARKAIRGASGREGPYADSAWFPAYLKEYDATFRVRWKPFVYFRRTFFGGQYINVDSAGHRRTVPAPMPSRDTLRVFFFGGSTMWGTYLRDSTTIASVAARLLSESRTDGVTVQVTNFGESGYVSTQEMLELAMQLRTGAVPHVVVFYDGINDVAAAVQAGEAGVPQNESNRAREFDFGRAVWGSETGVGSDWRAMGAIGGAVAQRFQFIQRLRAVVTPRARSTRPPAEFANAIATAYANNVRLIEGMSRAYGFGVVYVWQPTLHATKKRLTPFEQKLQASLVADPFHSQLLAVHRLMSPLLDSLVRPHVGARFVDQTSLFSGDTSAVFMDQIGHNTEQSIPAIVGGFLPRVDAMLDSVRPRSPVGRSPRAP